MSAIVVDNMVYMVKLKVINVTFHVQTTKQKYVVVFGLIQFIVQ